MSLKNIVIDVIKSVLPLAIVMFILQIFFVGITLDSFLIYVFGTIITIIGFALFLIGVENSLITLGGIAGKKMIEKENIWFIIGFSMAISFAVTVAEPGVQLLSNQLASISDATFVNKYILVITISLGVGIFFALAAIRFVYKISLRKILIISYIIVFIMVFISPTEFLAIAFDAGGATTGPTAVPFVLAFGIGMASLNGTQQETSESFGYVGLASIGPILAVLLLGVIV
ncbi:MAG: DUF1538 domain-containing protein [Mollicutes bacterium]|nr:DUF1538 domain-containing protein [Mollicutes bacterium]